MRGIERLALTGRWRRRHPGEKLLLASGLLLLALLLPPWPGAPLVLAAAAGCALAGARVPAGEFFRLLAIPAGFLAGSAVVMALAVDPAAGPPWLRLEPAGVAVAAEASLRALAATAALLLLVTTTTVTELLALLRRARLPAPIVDVMLLTWRLSALVFEAAAGIRRAQAGRLGYSSFRRAVRSSGGLTAALLPRVLDRARRMQVGLEARGYAGELRVLTPDRAPSHRFVAAALALHAGLAVLSTAMAPAGAW
jgi:cobalt/nickel transport system permease protein